MRWSRNVGRSLGIIVWLAAVTACEPVQAGLARDATVRELSRAASTVRYEVTWGASVPSSGQAPIVAYRDYILRGDLAGSAVIDTIVAHTVSAPRLSDTLVVSFATDTVSELRAAVRAQDTQGRWSGIAASAPFTFNAFPLPPNPPTNPSARAIP